MTKKIFLFAIVLFACAACEYTLEAQTFPATKTAQWDANPVSDNVTNYTLQIDANPVINVPAALDISCNCIAQQFTIPSAGQHTLTVIAVNLWGPSSPTVLTFTANSPGKSGSIRIK